MVDFAVVPQRTALVNVDMQNCFVHGSPVSAPDGLIVLDRINRVAAACRADELRHQFCRHGIGVAKPIAEQAGIMMI